MREPLVSVIIPTYSRPENLVRAIESVLNQSYKNIEIIVVDDNGKDTPFQQETYNLIKPYIENGVIQYIAHDINKNGSAARNTGLRASKGEYINFLDDDDEFSIDKIASQVSTLEKNTEYNACMCDTIQINGDNHIFSENNVREDQPVMEQMLLKKLFFNTSTVLFRKSVLLKLSGFDETFYRHQDWELYMRYFRDNMISKANGVYVTKHTTPNIVSKNPEKGILYLEHFFEIFKTDLNTFPKGKYVYHLQYMILAYNLLTSRQYRNAMYCIKRAISYKMPNGITLLRLGYCLLKSIWK